jgi:hypothetical protein
MVETIIAIGVGIVLGMYITSQITKTISASIEYKKFLKNLENYEEKETKQQKSKV